MRFISNRLCAIALAVALTLATSGVWAGNLVETRPEAVGLSSERLDRITKAMEEDVSNGEVVGALALVARNGKIAYLEHRGVADAAKKIPMTDDTIFRIYSMSKPITSVAVMILYEEGHFFLDDPVSNFIPELGGLSVIDPDSVESSGPAFNIPDESAVDNPQRVATPADLKTVPARRDMTIRDLLRHTSGLTYGFFGNSAIDQLYQKNGILFADRDLAHMVEKLGDIPLLHQPGEVWHYSASTDVLGRLVEVVSGQPFDDFLEERIFTPLGMVDTGFYVPQSKMDRFAELYAPDDDGLIPAAAMISRNFVNDPSFFSGGGGLVSTANDYYRFCQMMLNGGELDGKRILSRKTIELMTANHLHGIENSMEDGGYGFGLGFAVAEDVGKIGQPFTVGEYNWGGAAGTKFWIDPDEEFIGVYMVQILPHIGRFGDEFKVLAYQAIAD